MVSQLYYQYTHLNNKEIDELRFFFETSSGKVQLISSHNFSNFPINTFFGKLLRVIISEKSINSSYLNTISQRFPYLKLILINSNGLYFSPTLYKEYMDLVAHCNIKGNILWYLYVSTLYLYINLYRIRYEVISINSNSAVNLDLNNSFFFIC